MADLGKYMADMASGRVSQQIQAVGSIRSSASLMVAIAGLGGSLFASRVECFGVLEALASAATILVVMVAVWANTNVKIGLNFSVSTLKLDDWRALDENRAYEELAEYINEQADDNEQKLAKRWKMVMASGVLAVISVALWAIASLRG